MNELLKTYHINNNGVVTVTAETAYLTELIVSVEDAGTGWTFAVRDKQTTPMHAVPTWTPTKGGLDLRDRDFRPGQPMLMQGGIDIVTATGTPGVVDVWIWYVQ